MTPRAMVLVLALVAAGACSRARASGDANPEAPVLTDVSPDTIPLGQGAIPTLVLTGRGFVPGTGRSDGMATGGNTVHVGRSVIAGVDGDATGTTLRFALDLTYTDTTARGRPSGFSPGRYDVTVVTPRGTSNVLTLTMIR